MPVVLRIGRYRFFFFSNEGREPPYVRAAGDEAKFWLDLMQLAANYGFNASEINEIKLLVIEHQENLAEAWHEHFD
jgi:hypothetical protein